MNRKVKALVLVLVVALALALSTTAMAASDGVRTATVYTGSSYHQVTVSAGTYPVGSGKQWYENNSNGVQSSRSVTGTSYSSYWTASKSVPSGTTCYKASTTYNGTTVYGY